MYCNVKVSIWNKMRGDEYDRIRNKLNGLQYENMIWDGTETGLTYSTKIIKDVDQ